MNEDAELLRRYAVEHSEPAFAELIHRHVNLVYSAALRQLNGDSHRAQDVTQQVFTEFARHSGRLIRHPAPLGWLYTTTRLLAMRAIRTESRRAAREKEANTMNELLRASAPEPDWEHLRPVLEDAMHELGENDRHAVLLRFFENKSLKEVGLALDLGENAARMRVDRALGKLRVVLQRRGLAAGTSLASVISANAVQLAPANLTATLAATSFATTGTVTFTLLKMMSATQLKLGLSTLLITGAATALVLQHKAAEKLRFQNESLQQQLVQVKADDENLSNRVAAAAVPKSLPDEQLNELLKLRGEVGLLRQQTNQLGKVREENQRLIASQRNPNLRPQEPGQDAFRQAAMAGMNQAKQQVLAFILFANQNQGQYPTNFDQITNYADANFVSQVQSNFDINYQGSVNDITNPSATIVLKEKEAWQTPQGNWVKIYGFADGHSEVHSSLDGNFDEWERQHTILPPPAQ